MGSVIRHSLGFSNEENSPLLPRVVVHDVSTVVHVQSRGWFVDIPWARAALEGVGRYYQRIGGRLKIKIARSDEFMRAGDISSELFVWEIEPESGDRTRFELMRRGGFSSLALPRCSRRRYRNVR